MRNNGWIARVGGVACWLAITASAQAVLIDFESVPGVTPMSPFNNNTPVVETAKLSTQLQASYGVTFSSEAPYVPLVNLGVGHAASGIAGIRGATADNLIASFRPVNAEFALPGFPAQPAQTDFVKMKFDHIPETGATVTLTAFDWQGTQITQTTVIDGAGSVSLTVPGIHRISLTQTLFTVAFDDFEFNPLTAVPEPCGLAWIVPAVALMRRARRR